MKRRTRTIIATSISMSLWALMLFVLGYFRGVRGVTRGIESGLVVMMIGVSIVVAVMIISALLIWAGRGGAR